jgi:hypothetical protein
MKYLKTFEKLALPISVARDYMKLFNKERYADMFNKAAEKYESDKHHYRIYIPIKRGQSDIEISIEELLNKHDYEILDYVKGICKHKGAKNQSKIGQTLTRIGEETWLRHFNEDRTRKYGKDLLVCISRHAYDIAGADTDRNWRDCMTIGTISTKVKELLKELDKLQNDKEKYQKKIDVICADSIKNIDKMALNNWEISVIVRKLTGKAAELATAEEDKKRYIKSSITRLNKSLEKERQIALEYEKINIVRRMKQTNEELNKLVNEQSQIISKISGLNSDISTRKQNGCNVRYLQYDVSEGSLISYLIRSDDKNISDPISCLNIKPYLTGDQSDFVLVADKKSYGEGTPDFKKTVDTFLDEFFGEKVGIFVLNNQLYNDAGDCTLLKFPENSTDDTILRFLKTTDSNSLNTFLNNFVTTLLDNKRQETLDKVIDYIVSIKDKGIEQLIYKWQRWQSNNGNYNANFNILFKKYDSSELLFMGSDYIFEIMESRKEKIIFEFNEETGSINYTLNGKSVTKCINLYSIMYRGRVKVDFKDDISRETWKIVTRT